MRSEHIRAFIDEIGRKSIMAAVGLTSPAALTNAIRDGGLPAAWFIAIDGLCKEAGRETPMDFFKWKTPAA